MRRIENGKENPNAGIETIQYVKELLPNGKIIAYIANIAGTIANL